jgi:acetyl esterase/lipase
VWGPAYVGEADPNDPLVSPALAEFDGLPRWLIIAGGAECLLSCAERIAANAAAAGVQAHLSVYPDKVHGWMLLPRLPATIAARRRSPHGSPSTSSMARVSRSSLSIDGEHR